MTLGADYKQSDGDFVVVTPKSVFHNGDSLAFSVILNDRIGTTQVQMLLVHLEAGGANSTVYSRDFSISSPDSNELANRMDIGSLMSLYGDGIGKYRLEISDGHNVIAYADFTYAG